MAKVYADRVSETTTTVGVGTYSLAGAATGFRTFVAGVVSGNTCDYCCTDGTNWETGLGTLTGGTPDTLARTTIYASSNAGAAVNWGAGTKSIYLTLPGSKIGTAAALDVGTTASKVVQLDATAKLPAVDGSLLTNLPAGGVSGVYAACRLSTLANIALSGTPTCDGAAAVAADRIAVSAQTTAAENGIYIAAAGAWARASDMASGTIPGGSIIPISEGTVGAKSILQITNTGVITIATTGLTFARYFAEATATPPTNGQLLIGSTNARPALAALTAGTNIAITNAAGSITVGTTGLGTMATQTASSVAITGGAVTGITDITIADGGTGASDAATARTNLGITTFTPRLSLGTDFGSTGRIAQSFGALGTINFISTGMSLSTGSTVLGYADGRMRIPMLPAIGSNVEFSTSIHNLVSTAGIAMVCLCGDAGMTIDGTGITETERHMGFKHDNNIYYATNANGSAQTMTSIPSTSAGGQFAKHTEGVSIKFYNNHTLQATHTTNLPAYIGSISLFGGVSNKNSVNNCTMVVHAATISLETA